MQAQYRSFQDFTREGLEAARKGRQTLKRKVQEQGELQDEKYLQELKACLADDFDTPKFLALAHTHGVSQELDEHILKLGLFESDEEVAVPAEIQVLAQQRLEAKKNKDFARADALRKQLTEAGREVRDTAEGFEVVKG
ncbi:MAG: hypothetical protein Q8O99_02685 [bacterium]|nr:hypothetical protein [bacterium]